MDTVLNGSSDGLQLQTVSGKKRFEPSELMTMEHGDFLMLRKLNAKNPALDEMQAPYEHQAFIRETVKDKPYTALAFPFIIPAYSAAKAAASVFTIPTVPGGTVDAIFEWTGQDLGWDIYGTTDLNPHGCSPDGNGYHSISTDPNYREWCADHNRPIPVTLPDLSVLTFGGFWGGSPYLGAFGSLPPGEGGMNPSFGFTYMWHSHTERELVNNDIFPGGMMTMLIVEAPSVQID